MKIRLAILELVNGDRRTYKQTGALKRAGAYLLTAHPQRSVNINTYTGNGL